MKRGLVSFQIFILIINVISFSFIVGEMKFVSAESKNLAILPDASTSSSSPTPTSMSNKLSNATIKGSQEAINTYNNAVKKAEEEFKKMTERFVKKDGKWYALDSSGKITDYDVTNRYEDALKIKDASINEAKDNFMKDPSIIDSTGSKSGDWLLEKGWVDTAGTANFVGHIADGLFWSIAVVAAIQFIGSFVDDEGKVTSALSAAAFGGIMAGESV